MPIIPQAISQIPTTMRNTRTADWTAIKIKRLNSRLHLMIPKVHCSISPTCRKPTFLLWMEIDRVNRIKYRSVFLLRFMTLKCDMRFLHHKLKKITQLYSSPGCYWTYEMLTLPSIVPSPKCFPLLLIWMAWICEYFPN